MLPSKLWFILRLFLIIALFLTIKFRICSLLSNWVTFICWKHFCYDRFLYKKEPIHRVRVFQYSLHISAFLIPLTLLQNGSSEKREVRQFQFMAWPDHGVPEYPTPILAFLRRVKACNPPDAGPMVVHCRWVHMKMSKFSISQIFILMICTAHCTL